VEKAIRRQTDIGTAADVDEVVATFAEESRTRRQLQAEEARAEWSQRKQQRAAVQVSMSSVAKVSLMQTATAEADISATGVLGVAADDGLPTATMEVADEQWPVKLDSGARHSVAGTDWTMR
jgi:hypothetical protein